MSRKRGGLAVVEAGSVTPRAPAAPFRVSPEKTVVPDAPVGALERAELTSRFDPEDRRLTVFVGPGGFGKTTLLANCCRRAVARGARVVWLSVDEQDDAERVVAHLAYAAGLPWTAAESGGPTQKAEMSHLDGLLAAMRADERRWLLAVDELERIPESGARVIDYLIWRGPGNLHLALAGRQLPRSIDVTTPIAEGRGVSVGTDDLRFTFPEFASFFGAGLPRERLRVMWNECRGWPIAACLQRNLSHTDQIEASDLSLHWVASRLLRGISATDRDFVLQAACFEWSDAEMLDEVLGAGSTERLRRISVLRGLVQGADDGSTFRVHALVRRYAERELMFEQPGRDLHRRMAVALADRERTVDAIRHAVQAGDTGLGAEIFAAAGGIRLVLKSGVKGLQDAVSLLPRDATRAIPRADVACIAAATTDDPAAATTDQARLLLRAGEGGGDPHARDGDLRYDLLIVRGILLLCGCAIIGSREVRSIIREYERTLAGESPDPPVAAGLWWGLALYRYWVGEFDEAHAAARVVGQFGQACPSLAHSAQIMEGAILFARGDAEESQAVLAQARRAALRSFAGHAGPELIGGAFAAELALEINRLEAADRRAPTLRELSDLGAWLDVYAAALDVRIELAFRQDAVGRAFGILDDATAFARSRHLWSLSRWLVSVRVTALVRVGRVDEAQRLWAETGRPAEGAHVDCERETWRELEASCCARMRLLMALEDYDAALAIGRWFAAHSRDGGLARSQSLATALAMRAAWLAGDMATAREFLVDNLRLFQRTGFSRALGEQAEATLAVAEELDTDDKDLNAAKEAILDIVGSRAERIEATLSPRELEILLRLDRAQDKEIARELGITDNGVRYHIKKIYRKLGVSNRREAASRARMFTPPPPPRR